MTSQLAESDVASGDSYHTPNSAAYYTPPDARSLASADGPIDPLQSQPAASTPGQMGAGNSQVSFSRGYTQRAFRHALLVERYTPNAHIASLAEFLDGLRESLGASLKDLIAEHHGLKLWLGVDVQYRHMFEERIAVGHLTTHTAVLHNDFQIDQVLDRLGEEVQFRNANFLRNASPFVLDNVESAVVHVARYAPTQGGTFRELPEFLALKKCVVNVRNTDNRCFGYSILASRVIRRGTRNRPGDYDDHFVTNNLHRIHYPVEPNQVPEHEVTLKTNISVFSFYDDEGKARFPLYVSDKHYNRSVDLLYWQGHFALITNFERFLYDITRMRVKKWFCRKCFGHFMSEDALGRHHLFCNRPNFSNTIYTLPPPGTTIKFMNVRFQQRMEFAMYADCDALCKADDEQRG